jgi:hypothetical protein
MAERLLPAARSMAVAAVLAAGFAPTVLAQRAAAAARKVRDALALRAVLVAK